MGFGVWGLGLSGVQVSGLDFRAVGCRVFRASGIVLGFQESIMRVQCLISVFWGGVLRVWGFMVEGFRV